MNDFIYNLFTNQLQHMKTKPFFSIYILEDLINTEPLTKPTL
jgi:hypothetical protein